MAKRSQPIRKLQVKISVIVSKLGMRSTCKRFSLSTTMAGSPWDRHLRRFLPEQAINTAAILDLDCAVNRCWDTLGEVIREAYKPKPPSNMTLRHLPEGRQCWHPRFRPWCHYRLSQMGTVMRQGHYLLLSMGIAMERTVFAILSWDLRNGMGWSLGENARIAPRWFALTPWI